MMQWKRRSIALYDDPAPMASLYCDYFVLWSEDCHPRPPTASAMLSVCYGPGVCVWLKKLWMDFYDIFRIDSVWDPDKSIRFWTPPIHGEGSHDGQNFIPICRLHVCMFDYSYQIRHYNLMLNACWSSDPGSPCSGLFCQGYALYRVPLLNYYLLTYLAVVTYYYASAVPPS